MSKAFPVLLVAGVLIASPLGRDAVASKGGSPGLDLGTDITLDGDPRLEGTWELSKVTLKLGPNHEGLTFHDEDGLTALARAGQIGLKDKTNPPEQFSFKARPRTNPHALDILIDLKKEGKHRLECIYAVNGTSLMVAFHCGICGAAGARAYLAADAPRPTRFGTDLWPLYILFFKRAGT
jgi:uncharacterized protein (TIGR03067 family)